MTLSIKVRLSLTFSTSEQTSPLMKQPQLWQCITNTLTLCLCCCCGQCHDSNFGTNKTPNLSRCENSHLNVSPLFFTQWASSTTNATKSVGKQMTIAFLPFGVGEDSFWAGSQTPAKTPHVDLGRSLFSQHFQHSPFSLLTLLSSIVDEPYKWFEVL